MRYSLLIALIALVAWLCCACGLTDNLPESSLTIRDTASNYLLSTPDTTGTLEITVGETKQIMVLRTFTNSNDQTETDDVTQFANLKWSTGNTYADFDGLGNITGVSAGTALLEAKFRSTSLDPWDICRLQVVVTTE